MSAPRFVACCQVSTHCQGKSELGLDAQRAAMAKCVAGAGGVVAAEFEEVESGKRTIGRSSRWRSRPAGDAGRRW